MPRGKSHAKVLKRSKVNYMEEREKKKAKWCQDWKVKKLEFSKIERQFILVRSTDQAKEERALF